MKQKELAILAQLRSNSRARLTDISKRTGIPVSTIHDRLKGGFGGVVTKMAALLDFRALGYTARATIILKIDKNEREKARLFLASNPAVNNLFKINNGFDFMFEGVFKGLVELEGFVEELEEKFTVREKQVFYVIEEVVREQFLV